VAHKSSYGCKYTTLVSDDTIDDKKTLYTNDRSRLVLVYGQR